MRVAVTGANGFVGQAITQCLRRQGADIIAIVRDGRDLQPGDHSRTAVVQIPSLETRPDLSKVLADADAIIHAAGWSGAAADAEHARKAAAADIAMAAHIAEQARHAGKRLVHISSIKAVADTTDGDPLTESTTPQPIGLYGETKRASEQSVQNVEGIDYSILRPPMLYGPGMKSNLLLLFAAAKRGLPLPFASIKNRRDVLHVGAFADLAATVAIKPSAPPIVVAKDGEPLSTAGLYRLIAESLGKRPRTLPCPAAPLDAICRALSRQELANSLFRSLEIDDSASRRALDWRPTMSTSDALKETAAWLKNRSQA